MFKELRSTDSFGGNERTHYLAGNMGDSGLYCEITRERQKIDGSWKRTDVTLRSTFIDTKTGKKYSVRIFGFDQLDIPGCRFLNDMLRFHMDMCGDPASGAVAFCREEGIRTEISTDSGKVAHEITVYAW